MNRQLLQILGLAVFYTPVPCLGADPVPEKPLNPQDRAHWAFKPPVRPPLPTIAQTAWVRTPVDQFILARLETAGRKPSPPADKRTLLRRVYLDLVGLPPTPEEQDAFLADSSPRAFEKVVDYLLTSPHYGERWAQHWLDAVRFAESNGYEMDGDRPHAWRYRDYVVRSFNSDKPYDRFLTEQLAGDELAAGRDPRASTELLVAAGLHRCGPVHLVSGNLDPEVSRQEVLIEYVQGLGGAVLGMTIHCARCHDHKFDPVSQADYYRLEAFFAAAKFREVAIGAPDEIKAVTDANKAIDAQQKPLREKVAAIDARYTSQVRAAKKARLAKELREALDTDSKKRTKEQQARAAEAESYLKVTWDEIVGALSPEDRNVRQAIRDQIHALEAKRPNGPPTAWTVGDDDKVPATHVLKRGEVKRKAQLVEPAYPRVVTTGEVKADKRLKRADLAKWVTDPKNPLTARVFMNRVWQHHFGHGIVRTPNDFGLKGERPSHPELLDYLATEFAANGWQLKPIHRMIVLSATYQQSSDPAASKADPDNRLLGRMNRRRLDGEALRDAVLATAGTLNPELGGPSVKVPLEPEVYDLLFTEGEPDGLWPVTPDLRQHTRRSLYLFAKRNVRLPVLEAFDQPDRLTPCAERGVSTFAPQALILLNGPLAQEQSRAMAGNLIRECDGDVEKSIQTAYRRAFARPARPDEMATAKTFLREQAALASDRLRARRPAGVPENLPPGVDPAEAVALADFCLALMNANEFVYVR